MGATLGKWTTAARELATAALRLTLVVQFLVLLPFLPFTPWLGLTETALLTPVALALAAPLLPFHAVICAKRSPHLRWGYGLVVAYGPLLLLVAIALGMRVGSIFVLGFLAYEATALVAILLYVVIWNLGDAWFGDIARPRIGRRWAAAAVLLTVLCIWIPYVTQANFADDCADRGGRRNGWSCAAAD